MNITHALLPFGDLRETVVEQTATHLILTAQVVTPLLTCPCCGSVSTRIHSSYIRTIADVPILQRQFVLRLAVRRVFCDHPPCPRRIFGERLPSVAAYARRTDRLTAALQALAFAVGGLGSARLGQQLALPTSPRTQLRLLHAYQPPTPSAPRVVGLDDWAWKKGRSYGTICVDLERHQPIDLADAGWGQCEWTRQAPPNEGVSQDGCAVCAGPRPPCRRSRPCGHRP